MGMKVNIEKTEVQHVGLIDKEVIILIENQKLKQVKDFVYLGGNMSDDASTEQDVNRRIGCACGVMQNLSPVWKSKVINRETKARVYETLVLSVLLYNSETWTLKESTKKSY